MICPICNNDKNNSKFTIKEMQQGLREEFEYIECSNCGCLFIKEIPENMSIYYDNDYSPHKHEYNLKEKLLDKIYAMYLNNNPFIKLIIGENVTITTKFWNSLISEGMIKKDSSILDVGCGDGKFLTTLKRGGFKDLTGIDLFIDEKNMKNDVKIIQSSLEDYCPKRKYDVIISNHAFEHMNNQLKNIKCFENLVNPNGIIVIRIPVKTKPVWDRYGVNWYQIDAPRHFLLHTVKSFRILCDKTNLVIEDIIFDSFEDVFFSCEKYSRNISRRDKEWDTFTLDEKTMNQLKNEVRTLNENNEADQAIFVLKLKL